MSSGDKRPVLNDAFVEQVLALDENHSFDCKRLRDKLGTVLETVVAFANSDGGILALGVEDQAKADGRQRVFGIAENPMSWDELNRNLRSRITEPELLPWNSNEIGCTLRDGSLGSIVLLRVNKSSRIHSIVDDGTFIRLEKGNKQLTAPEITDLMFARGTITAEAQIEAIDFALLDTTLWRQYAEQRKLSRPLTEAMRHCGLAKVDSTGALRPTRAAVLLFADDPAGLLASKASIRVFHYRGQRVETDPNTNLLKPPKTIGGPVIHQVSEATNYVALELATGVQMGPFGFEIVQKYPLRVIREAITNAVIHRDYRLNADVVIRLFSDRIEIESPGVLIGPVTAGNIDRIGTHCRNPILVNHLREFPSPPNLDAGEGVRMMFGTMRQTGLYPPLYQTQPTISRPAVVVTLLNANRPSAWQQVSDYIDKHGPIGNREVRRLMGSEDVLRASKQLRQWVDKGLLVVSNPRKGSRLRKYTKPSMASSERLLSNVGGKQSEHAEKTKEK